MRPKKTETLRTITNLMCFFLGFIIICLQGYNRCCLVGHDWGGTVAWLFAIHYPEMVTKLIVLNCPHPSVFAGTCVASHNCS